MYLSLRRKDYFSNIYWRANAVQTVRVADPRNFFYADPDPAIHLNADVVPATHQCDANLRPLIRKPSGLHFEPPSLHCERLRPLTEGRPLKLLNLTLMRIRDPAFHSNANPNPDPASKNNADPCGSGSATLRTEHNIASQP